MTNFSWKSLIRIQRIFIPFQSIGISTGIFFLSKTVLGIGAVLPNQQPFLEENFFSLLQKSVRKKVSCILTSSCLLQHFYWLLCHHHTKTKSLCNLSITKSLITYQQTENLE